MVRNDARGARAAAIEIPVVVSLLEERHEDECRKKEDREEALSASRHDWTRQRILGVFAGVKLSEAISSHGRLGTAQR